MIGPAGRVVLVALALGAWWFSATHELVAVTGGSMEPGLVPGDVCVVRRGGRVRSGDVALFEHKGQAVLHRVIGVGRDGSLRTRGDANPVADRDPVPPTGVRGCVVGVMRTGDVLQQARELARSCATLTAQSQTTRR